MAKIPSIALIPSGVKATKVYSQLPVNGNGDFTFDRGTSTTQTRVNKDGLIEDVDQDVPRLDYLDGGCPSLLLEPSSTNLITYSEDFSNVAWSKVNTTISADSILSPDGSVNADKLIPDATLGSHTVRDSFASSTGDFTQSIFAKKGEFKNLLVWDDTLGSGIGVNLDDLSIFRNQGTFTYDIIDYGNDWYRISVTRSYTSQSPFPSFYVYDNSDTPQISYSGDGTSGIYIYGAQLEQQSYATSYIPTSGSTEQRDAETASKTGLSDYINSQEGVLYAEIRALANDGVARVISLTDGTSNNRIMIYYNVDDNSYTYIVQSNGTSIESDTITLVNALDYIKVAIKWGGNNYKLLINGALLSSVSYESPLNLSRLGFDYNSSVPFYGKVKNLRVYDSALTDTELEQLTGFSSFSEMASYLNYS